MYEVWYNRGMKTVGHLTPKVIKAFDLNYKPGEEITLSAQRKKHMEKHRQEFSDFDATYERIPEIIAHPTISVAILMASPWNTSNVLMVMFW